MYRAPQEIQRWLSRSSYPEEAYDNSIILHNEFPFLAKHEFSSRTKRDFDTNTGTPPIAAQGSSSPKKRKLDPSDKGSDSLPQTHTIDPASTLRSNRSGIPIVTTRLPRIPSLVTAVSRVSGSPPRSNRSGVHIPSLVSAISSVSSSPSNTPTHSSSDSQLPSEPRGRATNPLQNTADLQRRDKFVQFGSLHDNAEEGQLPDDAKNLFSNLWKLGNFQGIYPGEIQDEIRRLNCKVSPFNFREIEPRTRDSERKDLEEASGQGATTYDSLFGFLPIWPLSPAASHSSTAPMQLARAEFHHLHHIVAVARECLALHQSEASWNSLVHKPLLALSLWKYRGNIALQNATWARILTAPNPRLATNEVVQDRMVNFVLSPNFTVDGGARAASGTSQISNTTIDAAIQNKLAMQPSADSCGLGINHTDDLAFLRAPIAVTIGTKVGGGSLNEGRVQLGKWIAAWHARMAILGVGGGDDGPLLPTLPLILTHDHQWSLYFAVDRGHKIVSWCHPLSICLGDGDDADEAIINGPFEQEILGAMQIGATDTVHGIYRLLASLRLLAEWIETEFRKWVVAAFCPAPRRVQST